jgi:hypothetical protein
MIQAAFIASGRYSEPVLITTKAFTGKLEWFIMAAL